MNYPFCELSTSYNGTTEIEYQVMKDFNVGLFIVSMSDQKSMIVHRSMFVPTIDQILSVINMSSMSSSAAMLSSTGSAKNLTDAKKGYEITIFVQH